MTALLADPFPARGRGELPATPRGLGTLASVLGLGGLGAFALVATSASGATSGGVVIGVLWALIGLAAIYLSVRFAALARTAVRSCELSGADQARAVCVARKQGPLVSSTGRVVTATDRGILVLRARLIREPEVIAALPYRELVRCDAEGDSLELEISGESMRFAGVVPSQGAALAAVASSHVSAVKAAA